MDYTTFENKIISKIKKNKSCSNAIKKNQNLINKYLINNINLKIINEFINCLNEIILKLKRFNKIEKLLKNPSMVTVLDHFRKSDILIRACQERNKKAVKWLLTMGIDPNVTDKKGKIALMYAASSWDLESIVETLISLDKNQINISDENGNTALFYAIKVKPIFNIIIKYGCLDINKTNINGDTIFTYICKYHKPKLIKNLLMFHPEVDFSVVNYEGRTGAMYLAESSNFTELRLLHAAGFDLNLHYRNIKNETIVSIAIHQIFDHFKNHFSFNREHINFNIYNKDYLKIKNMARTLNALIDIDCDFNCIIDDDHNTPMIFFLINKDYVSALNLLQYCKTMDLTISNKYGISAIDICSRLTEEDFKPLMNIKNKLHIKFNYKIFMEELRCHPSFKINKNNRLYRISNEIIREITPYIIPQKTLSFQIALSEGYSARSG